jgi:menaquinol-cytochrome c reductase iron-sulfur subunit
MAKSASIDRRQFVTLVTAVLGTIMGAVVGLPAIGYLVSPALKARKADAWIPLGPLENYPVGVPTPFSFTRTVVNGWEKTVNSFGVFVVRKDSGDITAFSNVCTHLSCHVAWKPDLKEYVCPCHDGHFDAQGNVVSGPPPTPLTTYETKVEEGNLSIHFQET